MFHAATKSGMSSCRMGSFPPQHPGVLQLAFGLIFRQRIARVFPQNGQGINSGGAPMSSIMIQSPPFVGWFSAQSRAATASSHTQCTPSSIASGGRSSAMFAASARLVAHSKSWALRRIQLLTCRRVALGVGGIGAWRGHLAIVAASISRFLSGSDRP